MARWYTIHRLRQSEVVHHPCTQVEVSIASRNETIPVSIPRFSYSGFPSFENYYTYAEEHLAAAIYQHHSPRVRRRRAMRIAEDVIFDVLGDEDADTVYVVDINVGPRGVDRASAESFEEAGPKVRRPTLDSLIGLYAVRRGQECDEELERIWSESEHECMICMDDIEKFCESLTMPCKHVFHESCLMRWLDNNFVCPLCRYEMFEEEEEEC